MMSEQTIPPAPNWYLSNVLACSTDGTVAYGSNNNIVIVKRNPSSSVVETPQISIIYKAHNDRVTGVVFSNIEDESDMYHNCLASASDDGKVGIWNLNSLSLIATHSDHESQKVLGMDWSRACSRLILSGDEGGRVVCWELVGNTTRRLLLGKLSPTCLVCCPHNKDLLAIGGQSGLVYIVNMKGSGSVLYRLRGHDSQVVCLAWCPIPQNVLRPSQQGDTLLLASGGKDRTVCVWKAGGDGHHEVMLTLPVTAISSQQHRSRLPGKGVDSKGAWVCLAWPEPLTLLSSSIWGEIIRWDLTPKEEEQPKSDRPNSGKKAARYSLVHGMHLRGVFSIACPVSSAGIKPRSSQMWRLERSESGPSPSPEPSRVVWSIAQDRRLIACDWGSGQILSNVPTIGGFVYSLAVNPVDCNRVALGAADNTVRVWNLSNTQQLDVTCFWQKIQDRVLALAWHPVREVILAYATREGRVGLQDTSSNNKPPVLLRPHSRKPVYSLSWGPPPCTREGKVSEGPDHWLYVCSGDVVAYNIDRPEKEPHQVMKLQQGDSQGDGGKVLCEYIAWKPDYSLLAVGNSNGSVTLLTAPYLTVLATFFAYQKAIQHLVWHPQSTATDVGYSPFRHWLAVIALDADVRVFDLKELAEGQSNGSASPPAMTLSGHCDTVNQAAWSPHVGGQLATTSNDCTVQVWDVPQQRPIANFRGHLAFTYCVEWSPTDPDLLLSGGRDFCLRVWRLSAQEHVLPTSKKKYRSKKPGGNVPRKNPSQKKTNDQNGADSCEAAVEPICATPQSELLECMTAAERKKNQTTRRSFFPLSSRHHGDPSNKKLDDCQILLQEWVRKRRGQSENLDAERTDSACADSSGSEQQEGSPHANFFRNREAMLCLLDAETSALENLRSWELAQHLQLWKGNLADVIREATHQKKLSDWLVSMSPCVSQRVWMETCCAYAEQLVLSGEVPKAASYLLAVHSLDDALQLLESHKLYREAVALAKCRLGEDDPTLSRLFRKWAQLAEYEGSFELACECHMALGNLSEAARVLGRRKDVHAMKLAALVAQEAGEGDLARLLALQCLQSCLVSGHWKVAEEVAAAHGKELAALVSMHRTVSRLVCAAAGDHYYWSWLEGQGPPEGIVCCPQGDTRSHELLQRAVGLLPTVTTCSQLWLVVSCHLTLGTLGSHQILLRHLVAALDACQNYAVLRPDALQTLRLCSCLSPSGPLADDGIFVCVNEDSECALLVKSLQAYLCSALASWLLCWLKKKSLKQEGKSKDCQFAGTQEDAERLEIERSEEGQTGVKSDESHESTDDQKSDINKQTTVNSDIEEDTMFNQERIRWGAVVQVFRCFKEAVLDKESIKYYQDKVRIKQCEREVAEVVAQSRKTAGVAKGALCTNNERVEQSASDVEADALTKLDKAEALPVASVTSTDEIAEEATGTQTLPGSESVEEDKSEAVPGELEHPGKVLGDDGQLKTGVEPACQLQLLELQKLKARVQDFERLRGSVPNPVVTFCNMRNVLQECSSGTEAAEEAKELILVLEELWRSVFLT